MKLTDKRLLSALLWLAAGVASAQVVIVNSANANAAISREQAEQIFLGRSTAFPNGSPATPIDNAAGRDAFYQALSGKSGDQVKVHWSKLEFTGKGKTPAEAPNGKAVAEQVSKNPAAIGYVDKADVGGGVKAVLTLN